MRTTALHIALFLVTGCVESGVDSDTLTTGTGEPSTGTTGGPPTTGDDTAATGTTGTEGSSTGDTGTTGEADACIPEVPTIPEAEFVSTFINAICALKVECGCADDMCSSKFKADLENLVTYATGEGMTYDPECAAQTVTGFVTSRGCMNGEQSAYPFCGGCPVYHGDLAEGAMCHVPLEAAIYLFSEPCAGDEAFCTFDTCEKPVSGALKLGDVCVSDEVLIAGDCEEGTECDYLDSSRCEPELQAGESCLGEGACGPDLFCSDKTVCEPFRAPGEACGVGYECASTYCKNFVCTEFVWICEVKEVGDLFGVEP